MQWLNVLRPVVLVMAVVHVATSYGVGYAALLFAFANSLGVIKIFPYLYAIYAGPFGYYLKDLLHPRVPETHSVCAPFTAVPGLTILPIAILANNYAYLVWCHETKEAFVVDPADPPKVLAAIPEGVRLTHILTTHKHWDHSGGNVELNAHFKNALVVVGSAVDKPHGTTRETCDGDTIAVGRMQVSVLHGPGHTEGHVLFLLPGTAPSSGDDATKVPQALFTGDAIFIGGAGAFFEGSCRSLSQLHQKIHSLDPSTFIFCGHEYTITLLQQAIQFDPDNQELREWYALNQRKRRKGLCTVPSTLGTEFATNPFLRLDSKWLLEAGKADLPSDKVYDQMMKQKAD